MDSVPRERKVILLITLLALCAMLVRVGWVLGGSDFEPYAFAQDDLQTEEESQQIAEEQERGACEGIYDSQAEAQSVYDTDPSDPLFQDLDSDGDGIACELVFGEQGDSVSAPPSSSSDGNGSLMESGGPYDGPVPSLPSGDCPDEFPIDKGGACHEIEEAH